MSALLLDDVGMCLLRQLAAAWEASESYGETNHLHDYRVTSMNDLHRLGFEYATLVEEFYQHLLFIYANRAYWPRLTIKLCADINIGHELSRTRDVETSWYIAKKCVQAYHNYVNT